MCELWAGISMLPFVIGEWLMGFPNSLFHKEIIRMVIMGGSLKKMKAQGLSSRS
jgi:hypothetical protein